MSDAENQELRRCSDCRCTILLETYFSKTRKGDYYKTCDSCRAKRKAKRATPEAKAIAKAYCEKNKEKRTQQKKLFYEKNKEDILQRKKDKRKEKRDRIIEYNSRPEVIQEKKELAKENKKQYDKQYRETNQNYIKQRRHQYYLDNKDTYLEKTKQYQLENKTRYKQLNREYMKKRRHADPSFRISSNLRTRIWHAIKGYSKSASTTELVGCTIEELKAHLESKFTEGMTFENYGMWHVDHILPCASFDLSDPETQNKCFHYTNLQPLWALDNLRKSDKLPDQL